MKTFLNGILSRFAFAEITTDASNDFTKINLLNPATYFKTKKNTLNWLQEVSLGKVDISEYSRNKFLQSAGAFYQSAVVYTKVDELLKNSQFVGIYQRQDSSFPELIYFVNRFPLLLPYSNAKNQEMLHTFSVFDWVWINPASTRTISNLSNCDITRNGCWLNTLSYSTLLLAQKFLYYHFLVACRCTCVTTLTGASLLVSCIVMDCLWPQTFSTLTKFRGCPQFSAF